MCVYIYIYTHRSARERGGANGAVAAAAAAAAAGQIGASRERCLEGPPVTGCWATCVPRSGYILYNINLLFFKYRNKHGRARAPTAPGGRCDLSRRRRRRRRRHNRGRCGARRSSARADFRTAARARASLRL